LFSFPLPECIALLVVALLVVALHTAAVSCRREQSLYVTSEVLQTPCFFFAFYFHPLSQSPVVENKKVKMFVPAAVSQFCWSRRAHEQFIATVQKHQPQAIR